MEPEYMTPINKGYRAVAAVIAQAVADGLAEGDAEEFIPVAREAVNAWSRATNPVGRAETIYDEYHRLSQVTLAVLQSWDLDPDAGANVAMNMECLRAALLSLGVVPGEGKPASASTLESLRPLSHDHERANVLLMALTNATYQLVHEHGFSRQRVHELVDRALDA